MINTLSKHQHFRVWDKRHSSFMDEEEFLIDSYGKVYLWTNCQWTYDWVNNDFQSQFDYDTNFIIHQYIGMLDKFNKPIFEKDIILYPSGFKHEVRMGQFYSNSQEMNGVNEVKIENGHYLHSLPTKRYYICLAEVIGNLLETPELLKLDVQR